MVPAGRRSGKTERAKRKLVRNALDPRACAFPDPRYFAGAPTFNQAKRIWWDDLKLLSPPRYVRKISETDLTIWYKTGSQLTVVGFDKPERFEGAPWDGGVLDEYANMKEHVWGAHIRPGLDTRGRPGWCDIIGVPEGRNHYYDMYNRALGEQNILNGGEWDAFTWLSTAVLPPEVVEAARRELDELTFRQEYEASFVNFAGQAYYPFDRHLHCANLADAYNPKADLAVCFDFNVDPGVAGIIQEIEFPRKIATAEATTIGGVEMFKNVTVPAHVGTGVLGEVHIPHNSNTPAVCKRFIKDWGEHEGRVIIYGDATGGARGTAQTEGSDWDLVKRALYDHFGVERVHFRVPKSNPTERARINAVNTRLKSGDGAIHLMVDPTRAPNVVKDFEGVRLLEGGSGEIDKKADPKLTHISDAVGYYVESEYPVRKRGATVERLDI